MSEQGYFVGKSGKRYDYNELAKLIREQAPETLGKHISIQLEAIGLSQEMQGGSTPYGLPFSFAYEPQYIEKQLTSSGTFHTPGFFRALQNDYRIKGAPRKKAISILSEGYRLPPEEAEGLLSGSIAAEFNETTGTITYTICINQ